MLTLGGDAHVTANIAESQGVGADVGAGGGIYQAGGVVQLDGGGVLVSGNTAAAEGGGAYVTYYSSGEYPEGCFTCARAPSRQYRPVLGRRHKQPRGQGVHDRRRRGAEQGPHQRGAVGPRRPCPGRAGRPLYRLRHFLRGGGISSETAAGFGGSGSLSLTGGAIRDNEAASCYGGGVFCWGSSETALPPAVGRRFHHRQQRPVWRRGNKCGPRLIPVRLRSCDERRQHPRQPGRCGRRRRV